MSHNVESCPLKELNGGLSRLHSADEDAVSWLTRLLWLMKRIREEEEEVFMDKFVFFLSVKPGTTDNRINAR